MLGFTAARQNAPQFLKMAQERGIPLPLEPSIARGLLTDVLRDLMKRRKMGDWDKISWDRQDAFTEAWNGVLREYGLVR